MVGLEKITQKIIDDAQARADEIIADAQKRCDEIASECERKKQAIEEEIETSAVAEGEEIKSRAKSSIAMSRRDNNLKLRANMLDYAFESAVEYILSLGTAEYRAMMSGIMAKVIYDRVASESESIRLYGEDISPEQYEVLMNKKDLDTNGRTIIDGARRAVVGRVPTDVLDKIVLSEKSVNIDGGFIIRCGDIELNCSVKNLVDGVRPSLESKVLEILFPSETATTQN